MDVLLLFVVKKRLFFLKKLKEKRKVDNRKMYILGHKTNYCRHLVPPFIILLFSLLCLIKENSSFQSLYTLILISNVFIFVIVIVIINVIFKTITDSNQYNHRGHRHQ